MLASCFLLLASCMQISCAPLVARNSRHFWVCNVCGYEWAMSAMQQKGNWVGPLTTWVTSVKSAGHNPKVCQWSPRGTAPYERCVALRAMSEGERAQHRD
jgi:hypothetical protein